MPMTSWIPSFQAQWLERAEALLGRLATLHAEEAKLALAEEMTDIYEEGIDKGTELAR